jgi:hypothetical protein
VVDGTGEHALELRAADARLERRQLGGGLRLCALVVLGRSELEQDARVVDVACELLDGPDLQLEARTTPVDGLRLFLVVPEPGSECLLF